MAPGAANKTQRSGPGQACRRRQCCNGQGGATTYRVEAAMESGGRIAHHAHRARKSFPDPPRERRVRGLSPRSPAPGRWRSHPPHPPCSLHLLSGRWCHRGTSAMSSRLPSIRASSTGSALTSGKPLATLDLMRRCGSRWRRHHRDCASRAHSACTCSRPVHGRQPDEEFAIFNDQGPARGAQKRSSTRSQHQPRKPPIRSSAACTRR